MLQIKTYSPKSHKIKCLIYGASGTGKTTFWGSAENVIFASSEDGLLSIADKQVPFAKIETLEQLKQLRDFLRNDKHNFETLVIDSITDINERIKKWIEEKTWKAMEKNMWAELSDKIKWILFDIKLIDMNIIIIAQEKYEKDGDNIKKIIPSLNGKLASEICYFMDIVWYIHIDKEWERRLITSQNEQTLSKDRTKKIWNDTPLDFKIWKQKMDEISLWEEEVLHEIMTPAEKELIRKTANFENYKKDMNSAKNLDELQVAFKNIKATEVTREQWMELNSYKDTLKNKLQKQDV